LRGLVLSAQSKNTEALEALEPLLEDGVPAQNRVTAELLQADLLVASGRTDEALERLERLTPEDVATASAEADIRAKRAELLARSGRTDEARALLEEVRRGELDEVLGVVQGLHQVESFGATVGVLEELVAAEPDSVMVHFFLGVAQERTGDTEAAIATFQKLLEIEPEFDSALNYLGYLWIERGENLDEAVGLVRRAVELDPDNGAYLDSLGWGYYQQGRHAEARTELERAAELEEDATIFEHLGDVYRALGETEAARGAYRRALELEADDEATVVEKLDGLDTPR
jgi:tetratricopeptide (TPR) repeat protein